MKILNYQNVFIDSLTFLSTLTIKKVVNYLCLKISFYLSQILRKVIYCGIPSSLAVEPTTNCNLHCPECPSGLNLFSRKTGNISFSLFEKIINETHSHLMYLMLYFQGEPFLNKHIFTMIRLAKDKNIYTSLSTNGHFLDTKNALQVINSGLDRIIISVDGTNQEMYSKYRKGGEFDIVFAGIKNLITARKEKKKPLIIIQSLVLKSNEKHLPELKKLTKDVKCDIFSLKTAQFYDYKNNTELIPLANKYSRYKINASGNYEIKNKLRNACWRSWNSPVITIDGSVIPCCFDKNAKYTMGNISETSYKEIVKAEKFRQFRQKILINRKSIDICRNCTEGSKIFL